LYIIAGAIVLPFSRRLFKNDNYKRQLSIRILGKIDAMQFISRYNRVRKYFARVTWWLFYAIGFSLSAAVGAVVLSTNGPTEIGLLNTLVHGTTATFTAFAITVWFTNRAEEIVSYGSSVVRKAEINQIFDPEPSESATTSDDMGRSNAEGDAFDYAGKGAGAKEDEQTIDDYE